MDEKQQSKFLLMDSQAIQRAIRTVSHPVAAIQHDLSEFRSSESDQP
jgi:hypothetical protein